VALAAGIGASFAANKVWPTFIEAASLREVTGLPVLGTISYQRTPERRKAERRQLAGFLSGLGSLIVAFGSVIAFLLFLSARAS
jgi:hypothetical protein